MDEVHQIFAPGGAIEAFETANKAGKCRFIGFTGHHDPDVHLAMLKNYEMYDTILMPLNPADPSYLSFERDCISYVLSLPVHCLALGYTTIGQLEDDVRIAQQFKPLSEGQMAELRKTGARYKGPETEDWKRNVRTASAGTHRDGDSG